MNKVAGCRFRVMLVLLFVLTFSATTRCAHAAASVIVLTQEQTTAGGQATTPDEVAPQKKEQEQDENDVYLHSPMVIKLGAMLHMNPEQAATAFTIFNFVLLALTVGFALLKLLPATFRKRSSAIQKDLVDARTATEEATARLNSVEDRLSKLDEQIATMREQAEADALREAQKISASVEEEKKKILDAAEQEIQSATAAARRQIQNYAAELAISQAARKLVVTAETDRLLVENFAQKLGSKAGQN